MQEQNEKLNENKTENRRKLKTNMKRKKENCVCVRVDTVRCTCTAYTSHWLI